MSDEISYLRSGGRLNSFNIITKRRNMVQMMHDILVNAKDGCRKTHLQGSQSIQYATVKHLLARTKGAGLIEEIEATHHMIWYRKGKPTFVWKTTDKGLEWARRVWEDHMLVERESGE